LGFFCKIKKNIEYNKALEISDFIFPDGVGLLTYIKLIYKKKLLNLNGTDMNPVLIEYFNKNKYNIVLYGASKQSITKCVKNLEKNGINIDYYQDGYSQFDFDKVKENSILFVGMGTPIQEIWVKKNIEKIKNKKLIVITVGGYFDFEAGYYCRAPKWIREIKCEWIYRIVDNPKLQIPKYVNNIYFPLYLIQDSLKILINKNLKQEKIKSVLK
jgi:exopolysaccharide biosynthesis WecB/TagA/CpsF family protein